MNTNPLLYLWLVPAFFTMAVWLITATADFVAESNDCPTASDAARSLALCMVPGLNIMVAWLFLTEITRAFRRAP